MKATKVIECLAFFKELYGDLDVCIVDEKENYTDIGSVGAKLDDIKNEPNCSAKYIVIKMKRMSDGL